MRPDLNQGLLPLLAMPRRAVLTVPSREMSEPDLEHSPADPVKFLVDS